MNTNACLMVTLILALLGAWSGAAQAAETPYTLKSGSWVCRSPEAHQQAVTAQQSGKTSLAVLRKALHDAGQCVFLDDDDLEDLMAPFVRLLDNADELAKVSFVIEYYRRVAYLHRRINRMQYTGWTAASNLENYYE